MSDWGDRIKTRREELGMSQAALARLCRVKPPSVNDWESGKTRALKARSLLAIAKALDVAPDWITHGGPITTLTLQQTIQEPAHALANYRDAGYNGELTSRELELAARWAATSKGTGLISIPHFDMVASMGTGLDIQGHVDVVRMMQVSLPELRRVLPAFTAPENLIIVTGLGDSMRGTFNDGDPIVVDRGVSEVTVDGVYVLERGKELFIKRMQRQLDGTLMMISDNDRYRPQHITDDARVSFSVFGRALGVWNFMKL